MQRPERPQQHHQPQCWRVPPRVASSGSRGHRLPWRPQWGRGSRQPGKGCQEAQNPKGVGGRKTGSTKVGAGPKGEFKECLGTAGGPSAVPLGPLGVNKGV